VRLRLLVPLWCVLLLAAACSGDDDAGEAADASADASEAPSDPLQISTELGTVQGADSAVEGVRAFLRIPYAAPPTGADRWRPPQPREPYDGVLDATQPGGSCPQDVGGSTARFTTIPDPEEDCLTLSVWAPTDAEDRPVMFWIHGGGFRAGSAHQPYYAGDNLAARGVVVVNVNYRLGPLGFLATDELAEESEDGSYGNYGIADQQAGLEWVQSNIAAFGGDPDNVTIFGESAGGASVCAHLASPASDGLFQRAIVESGGGCNRMFDGDDAKAAGEQYLASVGCEVIACARDLPTDTLIGAQFDPGLTGDGVTMPTTGRERAADGELDDVDVMIGSNAEEAWLFTINMEEPTDQELVDLFGQFTDQPDALLALYPAEDYPDNLERFRAMRTDASFTCPTLAFADAAAGDTYVYHYTFESDDPRFGFGPTHGTELVPLFGHPEGLANGTPGLEGRDAAVSDEMQAAWVAFATTGQPGDDWPTYADGGQVMLIDEPFQVVDEIRDGRCDSVTELTETGAASL
jgi:para-nitrobenzyl esterase